MAWGRRRGLLDPVFDISALSASEHPEQGRLGPEPIV